MVEGFNQNSVSGQHSEPISRWRWWMIGLSICGAISTIAAAAFWWLTVLPPLPECNQISQISTDRDRLYCAQAAAESGELPQLLAGIDTLKDWTPDRPLYAEAQRWLGEWSEAVLRQAWRKLEHSDMDGAIELAQRIPPSSPVYNRAQSAIAGWQQHWKQGEAIVAQARTAMRTQQWDRATERIAALNDLKMEYWNVQARSLSQQMLRERQSRQMLAQARQIARVNQPNKLAEAIALLAPMNRNTFAWAEAQANLNQWGDRLLKHGISQWQQGQLDGAIATAKAVEVNANLATDAQNLHNLAQARKLAIRGTSGWKTSPIALAKLAEAVAAARQVKSDSRFYPQAQASLKIWQAYLEDLQQIQFAQATASLGHRVALAAAIEQAAQISPDRPRRVQAQSLIAQWSREIQRQEDRPLLVKAKTLAEPNTIPALQQAIAQARQVAPGRALRLEAQSLIHAWTLRIQTIEDQPTLDRARAIAQSGNLNQAIQIAGQISSDRALFGAARAAISDWQGQIRARERARLRAIREREAAAQRRPERQRSSVAPANRVDAIESPTAIDSSAIEPTVRPPRRSSSPDASSVSPPERSSRRETPSAPRREAPAPRRETPAPRPEPPAPGREAPRPEPLPPLELAPAPAPEPPAPPEPAPVQSAPAAIEKPIPALP
ncbi:hypothetical protein H6F67_11675 [Microcoleus sp. FACHB-1515]|uniref:hypothetical protein n=1 Tax=Cyanophyceae TaxID=3028117 RepID=UPI001687467E|nr:hypothetical protein [Microcoleus sp. FACHB-1515]MBD2090513.1 hypothetical protein [Microcoleus sp. FACHB-1515]